MTRWLSLLISCLLALAAFAGPPPNAVYMLTVAKGGADGKDITVQVVTTRGAVTRGSAGRVVADVTGVTVDTKGLRGAVKAGADTWTVEATFGKDDIAGTYTGTVGGADVKGDLTGVWRARDTLPLGDHDFYPSPTNAIGFAGQGGSWYPGATPPAEFWEGTPTKIKVLNRTLANWGGPYDKEMLVSGYADNKAKNILWKVATPGWSTSSPVVVGNRVITLHSPHYVVCHDVETGAVLWQDELKAMTLPVMDKDRKTLGKVPDAEQAKKLQFLHETATAVYRMEAACQPDLRRSNLTGKQIAPLVPFIEAFIAGLTELKPKVVEAFPDAAPVIDKDLADARKLIDATAQADTRIGFSLGSFPAWASKKTSVPVHEAWAGWMISDTIATPLSDGEVVCVQFGKGQTAAYNVATGTRLWAFRDPLMQSTSVSHAPSPLLWKDLVIMNSGGGPGRKPSLLALDTHTGAVRWETRAGTGGCVVGAPHGDHMPHYLARLTGAEGAVKAVIVTNEGAIVDAETGKTLIDKLPNVPGVRGVWGAGFLCATGNRIIMSEAGDNYSPPFAAWELKVMGDGGVVATAQPTIPLRKGQAPFALSDRVLMGTSRNGGLHCLADPHTGVTISTVPFTGSGTAAIAGNTLVMTNEEVNPDGRTRLDRMNLLAAATFDITDPVSPRVLSSRCLLGTDALPVDILDTYFPNVAKNPDLKIMLLGGYHGIAPGFGVYMAGATASGDKLFILSQTHFYCIGSEALGSPKDDPAVVAVIGKETDTAVLLTRLTEERPRYRRDALLRLAALKATLTDEQRTQVEGVMAKDAFEEIRAAAVQALDVKDDAGCQALLAGLVAAQKGWKLGQEDTITPIALATARALGADYFADRLPRAFAVNKDFISRQALLLLASNVGLYTKPVADLAIETLVQPHFAKGPERIHPVRQQNIATYLGLAAATDPRGLEALRKSKVLTPVQLMPVLGWRLPVDQLPVFLDDMLRSGKDLGYDWGNTAPDGGWVFRICRRMGAEKAVPVLEKVVADKPALAKSLQYMIDTLKPPVAGAAG